MDMLAGKDFAYRRVSTAPVSFRMTAVATPMTFVRERGPHRRLSLASEKLSPITNTSFFPSLHVIFECGASGIKMGLSLKTAGSMVWLSSEPLIINFPSVIETVSSGNPAARNANKVSFSDGGTKVTMLNRRIFARSEFDKARVFTVSPGFKVGLMLEDWTLRDQDLGWSLSRMPQTTSEFQRR